MAQQANPKPEVGNAQSAPGPRVIRKMADEIAVTWRPAGLYASARAINLMHALPNLFGIAADAKIKAHPGKRLVLYDRGQAVWGYIPNS